jgi:hypothetical protein
MSSTPPPETSWSRWYLTVFVVNVLIILFFLAITRIFNHPAP